MAQAATDARPRRRDPYLPRWERLTIEAGRYQDEAEVLALAQAKIRALGDEPLEVEISGRRPATDDNGARSRHRTIYHIKARVKKRREAAHGGTDRGL